MLLIDAYNVLHVTGILPPRLAGLDLEGLVALIGMSRYAGRGVTLVCDGVPPAHIGSVPSARGGGVRLARLTGADAVFAGHGAEADDLLESLLAADSAPRRVLVVSSDRRVRKAARRYGASEVGASAFLEQLVTDEQRARKDPLPAFVHDIPLDGVSVDHWLRTFGIAPTLASELARTVGEASVPNRSVRAEEPAAERPAETRAAGRQGAKRGGVAKKGPGEKSGAAAGDVPRAKNGGPSADDAIIREALEMWRDRLVIDELDMSRWLDTTKFDPRFKHDPPH